MDPAALPALLLGAASASVPTWAYAAAAAVIVAGLLVLVLLARGRRRRPTPRLDEHEEVPSTFAERALPLISPQPQPQPEPEPEPEPENEQAADAPAPPPPPDHAHEWDVAYDRGELGADGVWRFPHRCRRCGASLLARDVRDATAQRG